MILYLPWMPNPNGVPTFVLDVSVASAWRLPSRSNFPNQILFRMIQSIALVPESWVIDVAEEIRLGVRTAKITEIQATHFLTGLWSLRIWVDNETPLRAWSDTFDLARAHNISIDAAAYVELTLRMNLPLATIDPTLLHAANAAGVPIFTP